MAQLAEAGPMTPVVVLTTVGRSDDARALATTLVEARLAACVNILSGVESIYRWEGKVQRDDEQLLVIKTTDAQLDALKSALFARHPYEVPEFVVLKADRVEGPYLDWLVGSVG